MREWFYETFIFQSCWAPQNAGFWMLGFLDYFFVEFKLGCLPYLLYSNLKCNLKSQNLKIYSNQFFIRLATQFSNQKKLDLNKFLNPATLNCASSYFKVGTVSSLVWTDFLSKSLKMCVLLNKSQEKIIPICMAIMSHKDLNLDFFR